MKNYYLKNKEKYNEYQRDYQRTIYYPHKRQEEPKNKHFEEETQLLLPFLIKMDFEKKGYKEKLNIDLKNNIFIIL